MSDYESEIPRKGILPENGERVAKVATEIIEPALQEALKNAKEIAPPQEIVSALANCYSGLLVDLLGVKAASSFMRGHADHVASLKEEPITTSNS
jgi:hypothetical protein